MVRFRVFLSVFVIVLLVAGSAYAQNITATITGTVTSGDAPLPGASVTITSPQMQGTRTTVTGDNGGFVFPAVPPGEYTVRFELSGLTPVTKTVRAGVGQTARADADLKVSAVAEAITVTASAPAVLESTEIQTNVSQSLINKLPTGRTPQAVALLAPGTMSTGPRNAFVMSGATADQNLITVDGAVIQENLRGQSHGLFIEDAIQETTVMTGAISAEYGRFQGGVVNSITKSGGNEFHGSYRDNIDNPAWVKPSAFGEARAARVWSQIHEGTLGGRIIRDRLWFFTAGRMTKSTTTGTYSSAGGPFQTFPVVTDATRVEVKLTGQITSKFSLVGTWLDSPLEASNNCQIGCLTSSGLDPSIEQGNDFITGHFSGVITNNWFVESLYSRKTFTFIGFGGTGKDLALNSPMRIGPTFAVANAPYFCGDCGDETRNNNSWNLKSTYFLSTKSLGTMNIAAGYEKWAESRYSNNYQSPTNIVLITYPVVGSTTMTRNAQGAPLVSVIGSNPSPSTANSYFLYYPVLTPSLGSDLNTDSFFVNNKWDLNNHISFNLGGRYDKNESFDSLHRPTANDSKFSPRLGVNYDLFGDGKLRFTAGYNVYVGRLAETVNGAGSPAGTPATFIYEYLGPDFNNVTSTEAAQIMANWFTANGGTNRATRSAPNIPGATTQLLGSLSSPDVREYTVGAGMQLGSGFIRADYIDRDFRDFYTTITNLTTGTVTLPSGAIATRSLVTNTDVFDRTYKALQLQGQYRLFDRVNLGSNYTYSKLRGNVEAEGTAGGPASTGGWINQFPEYQGFQRNAPIGYLGNDQTHKFRAWANFDVPTPIGNFNFGAIQRYDSGQSYSAAGTVDVRFSANFYGTGLPGGVTNPGYASAPPASVTYFFSDRGAYRLDPLRATDLSTTYSFPIRNLELYVEGYVFNIFNNQRVTNLTTNTGTAIVSTAIRTHLTAGSGLLRFNPFTDTPKQCPTANTAAQCTAMGAHWQIPATFGTPTAKDAYQAPRTFSMALGLRF